MQQIKFVYIAIIIFIIGIFIIGCIEKLNEVVSNQKEGEIDGRFKEKGLLGVFYYPWSGGNPEMSPDDPWLYWKDGGNKPPKTWGSNYLPAYSPGFDPYNRLYSSKDPTIIKKHLTLMKKAGIDFVISSWWGQNHYSDQALDIIFSQVLQTNENPNKDIKFCLYYEKDGFSDIPKSEIIRDINYIINKYSNSTYYFKINRKPVIFVYNARSGRSKDTPMQNAQKWKEIKDETDIFLVLKIFPGYEDVSYYADSWHEYAPAVANGFGQIGYYSAFISPGFHKFQESPRLPREDFVRFENGVIALKNANVQFKLIETWNEWGEGTGIEPAQKIKRERNNGFIPSVDSYGTKYIDIIGKYFAQ